ncbi:hypothetical protein B484DRAFT_446125 [Ochromonadaceae sp. CCMP2298]|nr:hypothetical protein B484DRAFT_446125 [Ochromonadaceae sp. CCMP2298]|mmetsp:Transcript_815/g.1811  ORF Transcript_815/g.1811 Transcript_815/m.1811 type:complete len:277 (-) Transcript_815:176-1006(-)
MAELEQFCILAQTQRNRACVALIQQVISHKKIFVFGELLAMPSVQSLKDEPEFRSAFNTLELFAYGTFGDYTSKRGDYLELTAVQESKLKQLSVLSLAAHQRTVSYATLQAALAVDSVRALEDLIIETIYAGLLRGRLDPQGRQLRAHSCAARDVRLSDVDGLIETLTQWRQSFGDVSRGVRNSSSAMATGRVVAWEEQKFTQGMADEKLVLIKDLTEQGLDPLEELGEAVRRPTHTGMGMGMGMGSNRARPFPQGQRPASGKHPRRQLSNNASRR